VIAEGFARSAVSAPPREMLRKRSIMQPSETIVRSPTRRRFQFRLRTLMIVTTVLCGACAFGVNWQRASERLDAARAVWDDEGLDSHIEPGCALLFWEHSIRVARNLCLAECAVPFADRGGACRKYLKQIRAFGPVVSSELPKFRPKFEKFSRYKQEAEAWLAAGGASGEPTPIDETKPE
jgi:hypothetical protein